MLPASVVIFPLLVVQNVFSHHLSAECELPPLIPGSEIESSSCCQIPESYLTLCEAGLEAAVTCMEEARQQERQNRPGHRFGPGNRMQAPPEHNMGGAPGQRMGGLPGQRMGGPPGQRMGGPTGQRMGGPTGHRMPRPPGGHMAETESANFDRNQPPRRRMPPISAPCLDECTFKKLGLLNEENGLNHEVILEKGVKDLCDEWSGVGKAAVEHCLQIAPEQVPENVKCKSGAFEFKKCMQKQLFMNCPESKQNPNEECNEERSRLKQCEHQGHSEESDDVSSAEKDVGVAVSSEIDVGLNSSSEKEVNNAAKTMSEIRLI